MPCGNRQQKSRKYLTDRRVVLLHYSPIAGTVEGEPKEIYPYLGSSRLEEPLLRYPVDVIFHGHAHRGKLEARTINGVPVYNVAKPLLLRTRPDQPPFRLVELPREVVTADTAPQGDRPAVVPMAKGSARRENK